MLEVLLERWSRWPTRPAKIIASTVAGLDHHGRRHRQFLPSILIPGELFAPVYRRRNLAAKNLSRTTEDSGTVVVPLVPWSIAGVFMAGTLGVETLSLRSLGDHVLPEFRLRRDLWIYRVCNSAKGCRGRDRPRQLNLTRPAVEPPPRKYPARGGRSVAWASLLWRTIPLLWRK